jgi:hypothetical protein
MGKRVLGGKAEGKSPPRRPTCRWKFIMDFKGVKWIDLAPGKEKLWGFCEYGNEIRVSKMRGIFLR